MAVPQSWRRKFYPWTSDYLRVIYPEKTVPKCNRTMYGYSCGFSKLGICTYSNITEIDESGNLVCQADKRIYEAFAPFLEQEKESLKKELV